MLKRTFILLQFVLISALLAGCHHDPPVFQIRFVLGDDRKAPPDGKFDTMIALPHHTSSGKTNQEILCIERTIQFDQKDLKSAAGGREQISGRPAIIFTFTDQARKRFAEVTHQNIGRRLAILIGGQVYEAPLIQGEDSSGEVQFTGDFSLQEAENIAAKVSRALAK